MNLTEARKILKDNGFRLLKEDLAIDDTFANNMVSDIQDYLYKNYMEGVVEPVDLPTNTKPLFSIRVEITEPKVSRPQYIIGFYRENDMYRIFKARDLESPKFAARVSDIPIEKSEDYVLNYVYDKMVALIKRYIDSVKPGFAY